MLTEDKLDHLIVHGRCGDEPDFRTVVASHRDALDEIESLKRRVYGLKRRIHFMEGHNQYFERCESAWCNPSPDNDPAIQPYRTADSAVPEHSEIRRENE